MFDISRITKGLKKFVRVILSKKRWPKPLIDILCYEQKYKVCCIGPVQQHESIILEGYQTKIM